MKILELLISFRPGGAERVAVELASALTKLGVSVGIYSLIEDGFLRHFAEAEGVKTGSFGLRNPKMFPLIAGKLSELARDCNLSISYCTYADYALSLARTSGPKVLTIRSVDFNRWKIPGFGFLDGLIYGRADALIAVSHLAAETFSDKTGIPKERITVIRNGVNTEKFAPSENKNEIPVVLVAGRFFPVKRHDLAIRVSSSLHNQNIKHKIVFAGDGPLRRSAEALARELLPRGSFEFLGAVKDMEKLYASSDILLITSSYEGIPVVMLEAMASGLPVVSTRVGGIPEVIENGVDGFLLDPEDMGGLERKLKNLIEDEDMRREMGQIARKRIERNFSLDKMTEEYLDLFRKLL